MRDGDGSQGVSLQQAVDGGDLDELIRLVDGLCSSRDWDRVVELRDRCRHALERGLQLWPAAEYAEYRLALEAPASYAGPLLVEGAGRFALGPLWEVAASTHSWEELAPHAPPGPTRTMAAHERVMRGEDLRHDDTIDSLVLEIPPVLEPWEPEYPVATYRSDEADFPAPGGPAMPPASPLPPPGEDLDMPLVTDALLDLVRVWVEQSNGSSAAIAVHGAAESAISALGVDQASVARLDPPQAMAWMAWAAASGGAYGRRRGAPTGRFAAWWALCEIGEVEWPPASEVIARTLAALEWWVWSPPGARSGWELRIAAADPTRGLAWALDGTDSHREEEDE